MPRFFFHVVSGSEETLDEEGMELADLEAARREALIGIRSILKEELAAGSIDFDGLVRITDAGGQVLMELPFNAAVEVRNKRP